MIDKIRIAVFATLCLSVFGCEDDSNSPNNNTSVSAGIHFDIDGDNVSYTEAGSLETVNAQSTDVASAIFEIDTDDTEAKVSGSEDFSGTLFTPYTGATPILQNQIHIEFEWESNDSLDTNLRYYDGTSLWSSDCSDSSISVASDLVFTDTQSVVSSDRFEGTFSGTLFQVTSTSTDSFGATVTNCSSSSVTISNGTFNTEITVKD